MLVATRVRLYPTPEQAAHLHRQFGAVRFVYNQGLRIMSHRYQRHGQSLSAKHDIKKLLPVAKRSRRYAWLKEADSMALQQACLNLDRAFQAFFDPKRPARYPRFKRKHARQSSYHCVGVKVGSDWIKIPKLGPIKARVHRQVAGTLKSITVTRTSTGKHFASLLVETGQPAPAPLTTLAADQIVGLDMGLSALVINSRGGKAPNRRLLSRAASNLRRKQQALSRCQKGSRRRAKARLRVAKAHERLTNARRDVLHQLSRQIVDDNQAVVVETLNIRGMLKNRRLARHVADASWGTLITQLTYKAAAAGKPLVKLSPWYPSSKTCSGCGHRLVELDLDVRRWTCPDCQQVHDRNINAAINIQRQGIIELKAAGLSVSAH